jgi:hypothetical protein
MSENMDSDEHIQRLYNQTKNLKSPADLDSIILGKIRALDEEPAPISSEKSWIYLPIAASILLAVFLQFNSSDSQEQYKPIETVQLPAKKQPAPEQKNAGRNQLPETFFLPHEDINSKIVPACNGELVEPESIMDNLTAPNKSESKGKKSNLPIKPIYPNNISKKSPSCDSVSGTVFKKRP